MVCVMVCKQACKSYDFTARDDKGGANFVQQPLGLQILPILPRRIKVLAKKLCAKVIILLFAALLSSYCPLKCLPLYEKSNLPQAFRKLV